MGVCVHAHIYRIFTVELCFMGGKSLKNRATLAKFLCWHRTHLEKDGLLCVIILFTCLWCYPIDLSHVPAHYSEDELLLQKRFSEKSWSIIRDSIGHWVLLIIPKQDFLIHLILRIHLKLEHYWEFGGWKGEWVWCYDSTNEEKSWGFRIRPRNSSFFWIHVYVAK